MEWFQWRLKKKIVAKMGKYGLLLVWKCVIPSDLYVATVAILDWLSGSMITILKADTQMMIQDNLGWK